MKYSLKSNFVIQPIEWSVASVAFKYLHNNNEPDNAVHHGITCKKTSSHSTYCPWAHFMCWHVFRIRCQCFQWNWKWHPVKYTCARISTHILQTDRYVYKQQKWSEKKTGFIRLKLNWVFNNIWHLFRLSKACTECVNKNGFLCWCI